MNISNLEYEEVFGFKTTCATINGLTGACILFFFDQSPFGVKDNFLLIVDINFHEVFVLPDQMQFHSSLT